MIAHIQLFFSGLIVVITRVPTMKNPAGLRRGGGGNIRKTKKRRGLRGVLQ